VASIDYGDTVAVELLFAAGADRKARDRRGLAAHAPTKAYRHLPMASLLAGSASRP
jgi:hypothetical protein